MKQSIYRTWNNCFSDTISQYHRTIYLQWGKSLILHLTTYTVGQTAHAVGQFTIQWDNLATQEGHLPVEWENISPSWECLPTQWDNLTLHTSAPKPLNLITTPPPPPTSFNYPEYSGTTYPCIEFPMAGCHLCQMSMFLRIVPSPLKQF